MTKPYLDPKDLRLVKLSDAKTNSIVYSTDHGNATFLIGSGDDPFVIVLEGDEAYDAPGSAWHQAQSTHWSGLEVSGLAVRVDVSSRVLPKSGRPLRALIRNANRLYANCRPPQPNGQRLMVEIASDLPSGIGDMEEIFTRWQLINIVDGKPVVVHSIDVTPA